MGLNVGRFIVVKQNHKILDYVDRDLERGKTWVPIAYAMSGQIVFAVGSTVPVIQENVGCIGTGIVDEVWTNGKTTEVTFKYVARDSKDEFCSAMYALYMLQGSPVPGSGGSSSTFTLPGLGGNNAVTASKSVDPKNTKEKPKKKSGSIFDDDDDFFSGWDKDYNGF